MRKLAFLLPSSLCLVGALTGCAVDPPVYVNSPTTPVTLTFQGQVQAALQPVANATIQMYTVGTAGNGSVATPMLTTPVTTDSAGNFYLGSSSGSSIAYDYTCAHATDQVYIVATGGNPSGSPSTSNAALAMVTVLGNCGNLNANSTIAINELTTAAAVWALAPFMASPTSIGASATNSAGIANAVLDAQMLANPATGAPVTLPANLTLEPGKLPALADALSACAQSDGTTACTPLFAAAAPTGGAAPTDTLTAALDIVKHPGQNPAAVFSLIPASPPFPTTMAQAPNDWTLTLSITGGGIAAPTSLDIDSDGDVWVAGHNGILSEFSPQGAPLSGSGFGSGILNESYGLTIDTNGNIWVANAQSSPNASGSVSKFLGSNSATPGAVVDNGTYTNFYDSSLDFPVALSADTNGDIFIANYYNSSATAYSTTGALVLGGLGSASATYPTAIAADSSHGVWIANSEGTTVTHVSQSGTVLANPACCSGANGIATDALGNAWIANYFGDSFSEVSAAGVTLINQASLVGPGYTAYPAGVAVDAAQNVWIANYLGESISYLAGANASSPAGTMLSPVAGFGYPSTTTAAPLLLQPYGLVPDRSGNLWVSNYGNNNLVMFFGLAAPTATPVQPIPTAP